MPLQDDSSAERPDREQIPRMRPKYFSFAELAERWRCSRGSVYNRLRALAAEILDFAPRGKKGRKVVRAQTVFQIEERKTRRLLSVLRFATAAVRFSGDLETVAPHSHLTKSR